MRRPALLAPCLCLLPLAAWADTLTLRTAPESVTLYADRGVVSRQATVQLPEGRHELILPGLPRGLAADTIRVSLEGAALGATEFRTDAVPPAPDPEDPALQAAEARIVAAEAALAAHEDSIRAARIEARGAAARADFLASQGTEGGLGADPEALRTLAQLVGEERAAAERAALAAETQVRRIERARPDLEKELKEARAALAALMPPPEESAQLSLSLLSEAAGEVTLSLSYQVQANWQPVYDVFLADETLTLARGALVSQWSGESWEGVDLTLSTFRLNDRTAPNEVFPIPVTIGDPPPPGPRPLQRQAGAALDAAPMESLAAKPMMEDTASVSFEGPGVTYRVPAPVDLASGVEAVRVALDRLEFEAERIARAAPRFDETAFLLAAFTNDTREPLLASGSAALYREGAMIGQTWFEQVPAGAEAELAFGPIEALRLSYRVLDEMEGDRGLINRSNEKTEAVRMDVENLGAEDWQVQVRAAVPYAVQEDLEVSWQAEPMPTQENLEDRRGVLQWDLAVPAGTTRSIALDTRLEWPEGKVLR